MLIVTLIIIIIMYYILTSCDCHNKLSQTRWLKTIEFCLRVLEPGGPKSRCWQGCTPSKGSEENTSLPLLASDGSHQGFFSCGCRTPISALIFTWPFHLSLSLSVSSLLSFIKTLVIGFRAHPTNPSWVHVEILNFPSAKTLYPNKVTFIDFRGKDMDISFWGPLFYPLDVIL